MIRKVTLMSLILFILIVSTDAAPLDVGFVILGDEGPFTKLAVEFSEKTFNTDRLERNDLNSIR